MQRELRFMSWLIISFICSITIISVVFGSTETTKNNKIIKDKNIENETFILDEIEKIEEPTTLSLENLTDQMGVEISNISYNFDDIQQKHNWFLAYKEIIAKYPKELHKPTIYETFSKEELSLLYGVVQAETGNEYSFVEKINVISVIFNRLNSDKYSSLIEVLTSPYQFANVVKGKEIDEKTILACEYVFLFGDTTNGCMAFRSDIKPAKWYGWTYQFRDQAHYFYK